VEEPKITTHEDAWFAYIAELLKEIRDAVKNPATIVGATLPELPKPQYIREDGKIESEQTKQKKGLIPFLKQGGKHGKDV
jgi:hypothetical protein